jgi:hypothetical protein
MVDSRWEGSYSELLCNLRILLRGAYRVLALVMLLSEGFYKVLEPELYAKVRQAGHSWERLRELGVKPGSLFGFVPLVSLAIFVLGTLLLSVWGFIGWGAYRQLNNLGKGRSFFAFLIMVIFDLPIGAVSLFVFAAIATEVPPP